MSGYIISIAHNGQPTEGWMVNSLEAAREEAARFVRNRMDAFGDDREALEGYGFAKAEQAAMDMGERGDLIVLPDGWEMGVRPAGEE